MASVQLSTNKNGSFVLSGKDIYDKSTQHATFSQKELFAIINLWKSGAFLEATSHEETFSIGKMTPDMVANCTNPDLFAESEEIFQTIKCSATKKDGAQCTRPPTGDDGLCTQHRNLKVKGN